MESFFKAINEYPWTSFIVFIAVLIIIRTTKED